jgi:threonine 3-dehydrogenase
LYCLHPPLVPPIIYLCYKLAYLCVMDQEPASARGGVYDGRHDTRRDGRSAVSGERGNWFRTQAGTGTRPGTVVDRGEGQRAVRIRAGPVLRRIRCNARPCGECRSCALGFTNQCTNKRGDIGFNKDGGYGPYLLVNENVFFPTEDDVPLAEATMLLDVMGTTGHAIRRGLRLREDVRSLGIAGAGPVGLGALALARILLGPEVIVVISDLSPYRLDLARRLGGEVIDLREKTLAEGLQEHGLDELDLAVDTSGKGVARQSYLDVLSKRGVLVCAGHGEGLSLDISRDLIAPERAVLGSEYFCYDELHSNLELLRDNLPYLGQIITHRFALQDINEAFEIFFRGQTGKVLVEH